VEVVKIDFGTSDVEPSPEGVRNDHTFNVWLIFVDILNLTSQ